MSDDALPRHARRRRGNRQTGVLPRTRISEAGAVLRSLRSHLPVSWASHLVLAAVAYVPMLLAKPGWVAADTKQYLYLDPGRMLAAASYMWNPSSNLGTVTHENIGYLLPMGPFFWITAHLGIATWVAQRLWVGTILFAAGAGVLFLCRTLALSGPGQVVSALAYMLSPYLLQYVGRMSVILLPWAGLPWLVALAARSLRQRSWRYPAIFALVVTLVSGVNATAILYAGLAPVGWIIYATWIRRETTAKRAGIVVGQIAVLTTLTSLWWAAGLRVEAAYGINVLKYTETLPAVASTSLASESLRGLGYWYFYGGGRLGPWLGASVQYTQQVWLLALSFAAPALAVAAALVTRWRHRLYFALVGFIGLVLSVGTYPFKHPSIVGGALKTFMTQTTAGLALRSTDRATPLLILSMSILLGAGITALYRKARVTGMITAVAAAALVAAANPPMWNGSTIAKDFVRPSQLPSYYYQAAKWLSSHGSGTRVLAIPGANFAAHSWGDTIDPVMPGLLVNRPYVTRAQLVQGSLPTANLLYALDAPLQGGRFNPATLAPIARLMSAGDVLVRSDLAYWRYNLATPRATWQLLTSPPPAGVGQPVAFGSPVRSLSPIAMLDETALAQDPNLAIPPPLAALPISNPRPLVRAESPQGVLLIDGDASGLVAAADAGLLANNPTVLYAGSVAQHPKAMARLLKSSTDLVLTDTNRLRGYRWDSLRANVGYTETAHHHATSYDPSNAPMVIFPGAPKDAYTLAQQRGVTSITASSYGNPVTFTPEDRAAMAMDGNLNTAWQTGAFSSARGQWLRIELTKPVTTSSIGLVQPVHGNPLRWITKVTITFDGKHRITAKLGPASRTPAGQTIHFSRRTFRTVKITIDTTSQAFGSNTAALNAVGFAEVRIDHQHVNEVISMPEDMLRSAGAASLSHRLTVIMTRERVAPVPPRTDPERYMARSFWLPTQRTFTLSGTARISALIPDSMIDSLLGVPGSNGSGIVATSLGRLPGDLNARASSALDGNLTTSWSPGFGYAHQIGVWLQYTLPHPITFDHLNLAVVADGRHSVPTRIRISTQQGYRDVTLPPIADSSVPNAAVSVPLHFAPLTGSNIRITVEAIRAEKTKNYYSGSPITEPVAIAEAGIPGLKMPPVPPQLPAGCQSNLISIDNKPVSVKIVGSTSRASSLQGMSIAPCGPDASGITLGPGYHTVQTVSGHATGWNIDRLILDSAPGGGPEPAASPPVTPSASASTLPNPPAPGQTPATTVRKVSPTMWHIGVGAASKPFWLVLGESINRGWTATTSNGHSLGAPQLIDGFANGWYVNPAKLGLSGKKPFSITLNWTPQNLIWIALLLSGLGLLACLILGLWPLGMWPRGGASAESSLSEPDGRRKRRWLRRRHLRHARETDVGPDPAPGHVAHDATRPSFVREPDTHGPRLSSPLTAGGKRPRIPIIIVATVVSGGIAAVTITPVAGLAIAALTACATTLGPTRWLLGLGALGSVTASGAYTTIMQAIHHYPPGAFWPGHFATASQLAWLGLAMLTADVVVELARWGRGTNRYGASTADRSQASHSPSP